MNPGIVLNFQTTQNHEHQERVRVVVPGNLLFRISVLLYSEWSTATTLNKRNDCSGLVGEELSRREEVV